MFHSHISIFFYLSPIELEVFCYRSFPIITGHGTENVLLMKFEILGLVLDPTLSLAEGNGGMTSLAILFIDFTVIALLM